MTGGGTGIENRVPVTPQILARIESLLDIHGETLDIFIYELEHEMGLYKFQQREESRGRIRAEANYYKAISKKCLELASFIENRAEELKLRNTYGNKDKIRMLNEMAKSAIGYAEQISTYSTSGRPIDRPGQDLVWGLQELYENTTGKQAGYSRGSIFHSLLAIVYEAMGEAHGDMTSKLRPLIAPFKNL